MLKKHPVALELVWFICLILFPLPLILLLNTEMSTTTGTQILIIDSGLVAYSWWLAEVLLSTRPRWLDRLIGLPSLYFVHSLLGAGSLILAFVHHQFMTSMGYWIQLTGNIAWYLLIFGIIYASIFLSGWFVDRFRWAAQLKQKFEKVFKHQLSIWLHRLNLIVIIAIWLHVHLIGRINFHLGFMLVFDTYTVLTLACYLWKKWILEMNYWQGKLVENASLSSQTRRLVIDFGSNKPPFKAGDYFFFIFKDISTEAHPFSISNSQPDQSDQVVLTVRELGDYTRKLSALKLGSPVKAEGPFGRFDAIVKSSDEPLVLIGMGTGVAPLLNIAAKYYQTRSISLIWTVTNEQEMYFDSYFKDLEQKGCKYHVQVGRLKPDQLTAIVSKSEVKSARFLVVGGARSVINVEKMLRKIGVQRKNIFDERLTM